MHGQVLHLVSNTQNYFDSSDPHPDISFGILSGRDPHLSDGETKKKVAETLRTSAIRSAHSCHVVAM